MDEKKTSKNDFNLWDLSSLGVEFTFILVIFVYLGSYLDEKFKVEPFGILISSITGLSFGIYYLIQRTRRK